MLLLPLDIVRARTTLAINLCFEFVFLDIAPPPCPSNACDGTLLKQKQEMNMWFDSTAVADDGDVSC